MSTPTFFTDNELTRWVWIDLEMTGLDEDTCSILQAAMVITDPQLQEIVSKEVTIWQPESALERMSPFVTDMHTKNGLLARVRKSTTSLQEAEKDLMTMLTQNVSYKKGALAGNSIYMDRRFLSRYMPQIDTYLHYRQIDVSSIKIVSRCWYGNRGQPPKKPSTHTALEDIRQSIDELRYYRQNCFVQQ